MNQFGLVLDVFDTRTPTGQPMRLVRSLDMNPVFVSQFTGQFDPLFSSPGGTTVYFAWTLENLDHTDGPAYLDSWDVTTGAHRVVPLGSKGMDGAAAIAEGRVMAVTDTAAVTLDGRTLQTIRSTPLNLGFTYVAVSPLGGTLAVQSGTASAGFVGGDTFSLVDIVSGVRTPAAGSHAAQIDNMEFTPDGRRIVTGGDDGAVIVWDAATGAPIETLSGHAGRVVGQAISADGKTVYASGLDGAIFQWDLAGSQRFGRLFNIGPSSAVPQHGFPKPALAMSPDSSRFAARIAPGRVGIFEIATPHLEHAFSIVGSTDVFALAWSKDQQLAIGTDQGPELWDLHGAPTLVKSLTGVSGSVHAIAFSPDGHTVAAVTDIPVPPSSVSPDGGQIGVWDAASGRLVASRDLGIDGLSVTFDRGGRRLAVGTDNARVLIDDPRALRVERTVSPLGAPVSGLSFEADGTLFTGSWAGIVEHWNPQTGARLGHPVLVEAAPVASLAIAPGGGTFATTGGSSGGVKIWDEHSLQQYGSTFPGGAGFWGNAQYTPDGSNIVVVYGDGSAAVWPVSVRGWMDHACAVARRNFTQEEWSRFVPNQPYQRTCPSLPSG